MAHSYVEFRGKGFHLNDSDLVVFARLLARTSQSNPPIPSEIANLLGWWEKSLDSCGPGCIDLRLDEFVTNPNSVEYLCSLLNAALAALRQFGTTISVEQLNEIAKAGARFVGQLNTKDFEAIASRFQHLIGCPVASS
jgi:hypothetical protein